MPKANRQKHLSLLATVAGWTLLVLVIYRAEEWLLRRLDLPFLKWEYAWQDLAARLARPAKRSPDIFFLAIDAPSHSLDQLWEDEIAASPALQLMKQRDWPRDVYVHVLERLVGAGAKVVAFDVIFPYEGPGDSKLREALDRYRANVIIGAQVEETKQGGAITPPSHTVIPPGIRDDDRVGIVSFWQDEDGVYRRARFRLTRTELRKIQGSDDQEIFESLSARMARKGGYADRIPMVRTTYLFRFAFRGETLREDQKPPSLYQIFVPTYWEKNYDNGRFFKDKIVLVGPEGNYNKDILPSPFGQIAGPEFHMNALNAIINGEFLRQTALGIDLLLILLGGATAVTLAWFIPNPWWRLLLLAVASVGWFQAGVWLYNSGWVIPILSPMLAISGSGALFSVGEWLLDRREKARVRKTFERYVSKDVVKELMDNPESWLNTLGGQRKLITVLFSDVRGFTTLSESADEQVLVAQLNEYFDEMVNIVFKHEGTLDKFIGDAVMAQWGAISSSGTESDARRAVATAIAMRKALTRLNPGWLARGMTEINIGIGINHGSALVGNIGAEVKKEVTAIGDTVNVASRLEGVTKQYGVDLCIGEAVAPLVREVFVLRSLDLILMQGKTKPQEIFTVLKEREAGDGDPPWLAMHEEAIRCYRGRDFAEAERLWREVLAQCPGDSVAEVFLERCAALQKTPPEGEWDGVFEMKSK
jgi:adenylate cyclase